MGMTNHGQLLVAAIPVLIGVYATLLGLGLVGKKPDVGPALATRLRGQRRTLCILGPGAIAFGLFIAFSSSPPPPATPEAAWQRHTSDDGACSVEFPGNPETEVETVGKTAHHDLVFKDEQQNVLYRLTTAELPAPVRAETVEKQLDSARDVLALLSKQSDASLHLVGEHRISQDDVPGREMEYTTNRDEVIWIRFFLKGKHFYRLLAAAPRDRKDADIRRFLHSVRFKNAPK